MRFAQFEYLDDTKMLCLNVLNRHEGFRFILYLSIMKLQSDHPNIHIVLVYKSEN